MNDSKKLTKIILVSAGILMLFRLLGTVLPSTIYFLFDRSKFGGGIVINIILFLVTIAMITAVIKLFFIKNDWLAGKIVKSESADSSSFVMTTESFFRLAAFLVGCYVLVINSSGIFMVFRTYLRFRGGELEGGKFRSIYTGPGGSLASLLPYVILLVFAVYFIFGAPHLVRWHVKRSEQLAADIAKAQDSSDGSTER
ncbi:MAG: hypothetical protein KAS96_04930 [Planctomycetes bacterium]|nr:hypothetical protein [Planctomycetota bacterium]